MSKFGMQIGKESVYGIKTPDKALDLITKVIEQYFGEYWTQHKPRCPLCDEGLQDTERHMNRPVGECVNTKCNSTIHISDFMGKIQDVLEEWGLSKDNWKKEVQEELKKKVEEERNSRVATGAGLGQSNFNLPSLDECDTEVVDEETIFIW